MALLAGKICFSEERQELVRDFECGDKRWDEEAATWIKAPASSPGALMDMQGDRPAEVWLYPLADGRIVGFGSLCLTNWRWPLPTDQAISISLIPFVAIRTEFQGQHYFTPILQDILATAMAKTDGRHRAIGLFVDPENEQAIAVYKYKGFVPYSKRFLDKATNIEYISMIYRFAE